MKTQGNKKQKVKITKAADTQSPPRDSRKTVRKKIFYKKLIATIFIALLLIIAIIAALKLLFIVKKIEISGSEIFSSQDIENFCDIPMEVSVFSVNINNIEQALLEEFKYLEAVSVKRRLPDRISIELTDSIETYYTFTPDDGGVQIYSQNFKPLRSAIDIPMDILCIDADLSNLEIQKIIKEVIEILDKINLTNITSLSIKSTSDIGLLYENRIDISLGTMLDIEYKLKMCNEIILNKIPQGEAGILDATIAGEVVYKPY